MKTSLILIAVVALVMLPAAFAQSTSSQDPSQSPSASPSTQSPSSQSPDTSASPTSQSPDTSASPSSQSPSTSSGSSASSTSDNSFVGSIMKDSSGKYVLHAGGADYQLDDQSQAGKFEGKSVKVTGKLDSSSNTIKVQSIEPASSM